MSRLILVLYVYQNVAHYLMIIFFYTFNIFGHDYHKVSLVKSLYSQADGWYLWRPCIVKSISWETVSLNSLLIFFCYEVHRQPASVSNIFPRQSGITNLIRINMLTRRVLLNFNEKNVSLEPEVNGLKILKNKIRPGWKFTKVNINHFSSEFFFILPRSDVHSPWF